MIRITNIRNANKSYDENWAIVLSLKSTSGLLTQIKDLAPSSALFTTFQNLKNNADWNESTFNNIYVPQFITDLKGNDNARRALDYLWNQDKQNKKICLVCFCSDERLCHRSIIAGILAGAGCNVITDTGNNYNKYYNMYMQ